MTRDPGTYQHRDAALAAYRIADALASLARWYEDVPLARWYDDAPLDRYDAGDEADRRARAWEDAEERHGR